MPFELRLPPAVRAQIEEYIERFDVEFQMEALAQIRERLEMLAENPRLGSTPRGAFGFPIYSFTIRVDDIGYHLRAVYCYSQDERAIIVTILEQQLF